MLAAFFAGTACLLLLAAARVLYALWSQNSAPRPPRSQAKASLLVVLGSGGHTTEIIGLLRKLPPQRYGPVSFVRAASDISSEPRMRAAGLLTDNSPVYTIHRSREVGQSYITAVFSTLQAFWHSLLLVARLQPDCLLGNGPGTCLPLCVSAVLLSALLRPLQPLPVVIFVESLCRVNSLSMTGKLLYHLRIASSVMVQWPQLKEKYPRAEFIGLQVTG